MLGVSCRRSIHVVGVGATGKKAAAERRKNVATAEGRGLMSKRTMSRGAAKDSSAAPRLIRQEFQFHGLEPWLSSFAAPRLKAAISTFFSRSGRAAVLRQI